MEKLKDMPERQIMPRDVFTDYVNGRKDTFASDKDPILNLNIPGWKGYQYHRKDSSNYYQDNYHDDKERPGNFGGFEIMSRDSYTGKKLVFYGYAGGLTKAGEKFGEAIVYTRLRKFLKDHVEEVRFGKSVAFDFENGLGKWVYEGKGRIEDYGWEDGEFLSLNGAQVYKLRGTGLSFIKGF